MYRIEKDTYEKYKVIFSDGADVQVPEYFKGEYLETFFMPEQDGQGILYVGTKAKFPLLAQEMKELGAKTVKTFAKLGIREFMVEEPTVCENEEAFGHLILGCLLGASQMVDYKERTRKEEKEMVLHLCADGVEKEEKIEEADLLCQQILFARRLTNQPANLLRPMDFAQEVCKEAEERGMETQILDVEALEKMGMGALLGVGKGSQYPPCMAVLTYKGNPESTDVTGLVGKGITMDTGGYCLKQRSSMMGMMGDMGGGAAVAGAMCVIAEKKLPVNVTAVIPMAENRVSGGAFVPGDILRSYAGDTIEVQNTDAEGRLILADAVSYAVRDCHVTRVLDIATLTGAVVSMLGHLYTGVICDEEQLWEKMKTAAEKSGDRCWLLPFGRENEQMIESHVADIKNMGGSTCGTISAGLFIRHFAEQVPWIHLDIAGTAWNDEPIYEFQEKMATGVGVELLYRWVKEF